MQNYWYISGDFYKERSKRIGSSDIPCLIPNPERPTESLTGYGTTPVTVWMEKTGRKQRDSVGLPAEMGHYLEPKAVELFIRDVAGTTYAKHYLNDRARYDWLQSEEQDLNARAFQSTKFLHHVQWYNEDMIAHPDCLYDPGHAAMHQIGKQDRENNCFHVLPNVDLEKPFIVEAKSARYFATRRPEYSCSKGYDMALFTWHGIPLSHYMQIQYQLALLGVSVAYLALLYDTSSFHVWEIKANPDHQAKIMEIASRISWHIKKDTQPRDFVMNANDVVDIFPTVQEDFVYVSGDEEEEARKIALAYQEAKKQEKIWKEKKQTAMDAIAVLLKDRGEIRSSSGILARWKQAKAYEKIAGTKKIRENHPDIWEVLKNNDLVSTVEPKRSPDIKYKGE